MKLNRILIRADAGGITGTGHVMRMIALAQAYLRRGGSVAMASVNCSKRLVERVHSHGITHHTIKATQLGDSEDAELTVKLAKELGAQWLVVDGYHFDYAYQKHVKNSGLSLLCTDDHGYSKHWCCDAILNQNLDAEKNINYENDVIDFKRLLGASFCLFREEFLQGNQVKKPWKQIDCLLITLGGSDPENATAATLRLLNASISRSLTIRVLAGADNPHVERLRPVESHHQIEVIQNATNMPEQYAWADGIISAGGSTCWEWLYLGLPGAIVTIADNQLPIVQALTESRQVALSLGWFNGPVFGANTQQLSKWIDAPSEVCDAQLGRQLIDGRGADRVAALFNHRLKVDIITTAKSWLMDGINVLHKDLEALGHLVAVATKPEELGEGDILLILSYWGLLSDEALSKHVHNLVVHESALPEGKGWSPLTWQVLEGKWEIPITLFEAVKKVDAGDIYLQAQVRLKGHELIDGIRLLQAQATFDLCQEFVAQYPQIVAIKQAQSGEETFYPRRGPKDSCLDPEQSISDQFNLLRVVDNESYPAFFEYNNHRYVVKIEKCNEE
jgi:UDP-2,4-diacetamido-2,4,6-trideoxy-beta-L-altropyranose hydrolase